MNAGQIKRLVGDAERAYSECWDVLTSMRSGNPSPQLPEFQHNLARAMQSLESAYQSIARSRQRLMERKDTVSRAWFARQQSRLAGHQKTLRQAIGVGYSLGDAFAWFFYQFDRALLDKHAAHERQTHPTSGVGGQAELAALVALRHVGYVPIYHGITTILRLGDITLVDMKLWRVAAIGEVKTGKPDATGWAELTVTFTGHQDNFPIEDFNRRIHQANRDGRKNAASSATGDGGRGNPTARARASSPDSKHSRRFERQLNRTLDGMKAARKADSAPGSGMRAEPTALRALDDLARSSRCGHAVVGRLDSGLVAVVYRSRLRSLFARLSKSEELDPSGFPPAAMPLLQDTIVKGSAWNNLVFRSVHYDNDGLPVLLPGTVPVPWWPVAPLLARDILLHTVTVVTVWNPASLLQRLEEAGFEVDGDALPHRLRLTWRSSDGRRWSYNDDGFSRMIPMVLAREEDVAATILRFCDHAQSEPRHGRRTELRVAHQYFSEEAVASIRGRRSPDS